MDSRMDRRTVAKGAGALAAPLRPTDCCQRPARQPLRRQDLRRRSRVCTNGLGESSPSPRSSTALATRSSQIRNSTLTPP